MNWGMIWLLRDEYIKANKRCNRNETYETRD